MTQDDGIQPTVFIVDDDPAVRDALSWLIGTLRYNVEVFESAQAFLDACQPDRPGCLVLDVRLPGMSGLQLQKRLAEQGIELPVIIITGHGDVPMAVSAIQAGALNFLEKPFRDQEVLDSVQQAIMVDAENRARRQRSTEIMDCIEALTPREYEVMKLMVKGDSNKKIAATCGISIKTVEVHRARVMEKMRAGSLPELVRMVLAVEPE